MLFLGKVFISVCAAWLAYAILDRYPAFQQGGAQEITSSWLVVLVTLFFAYAVTSGFMNVFDMSIDTIFLSYAIVSGGEEGEGEGKRVEGADTDFNTRRISRGEGLREGHIITSFLLAPSLLSFSLPLPLLQDMDENGGHASHVKDSRFHYNKLEEQHEKGGRACCCCCRRSTSSNTSVVAGTPTNVTISSNPAVAASSAGSGVQMAAMNAPKL